MPNETKSVENNEIAVPARSLLGVMEPYTLGECFEEYLERLKNFFELNAIKDDVFRVRLLMNYIGPMASAKISKSCKPKQPSEALFLGEKKYNGRTLSVQHEIPKRRRKIV
jgi:hypothetical protein